MMLDAYGVSIDSIAAAIAATWSQDFSTLRDEDTK